MFGDRPLLSSPTPDGEAREQLSYREVRLRSQILAGWLWDQGVRVGTRVALGGLNSAAWVVAFCAVHIAGAVPVLLNSTLPAPLQKHCLLLTEPKITLVDGKLAALIQSILPELRARGIDPYCWDHGMECGLRRLEPSASAEAVRALDSGRATQSLHPESDGMIMFTSGTTNHPKAVLVTQRSALSHVPTAAFPVARAILRAGGSLEDALAVHDPPKEPSVMLVPVPLFHVTGCLSWLLKAMTYGHKVVFTRRWNVPDAIKLIVDERVDVIGGVPAIATSIIQSGLLPANWQFKSVGYGGAPPPAGLPEEIVRRWPNAKIANGYGMTETNGIITSLVGADYVRDNTSCGPPVPICEIRIVDPEDASKEMPTGTPGVLMARGSMLMEGYLRNEEATRAAVSPDGWFNTGDVGYVDAEGFVTISDRAKDIIIRGGENIASGEVENAITADSRIEHAAAVPVPDKTLGELVAVAVTLAPGASATPESIIETAFPRLRHAARPVFVMVFEEDFPRAASGKVLKKDIKEIVAREFAKLNRAKL